MCRYVLEDITEIESTGELSFAAVFFRLYDKKIAAGEITFSSLKMSKAEFTAMCMNGEYVPDIENVLELCSRMLLAKDEAELLLNAAGYGFR